MRTLLILALLVAPAQAGRRYCYSPCIKYHEPVYQKLYEPVVEPLGEPVYQQAVLPQEQTVYAYGDAVVKIGPEVDIEAATFRLLRTHEAYVAQVPEITAQMTGMIQSLAAARVEATYKITSETGQVSTLGETIPNPPEGTPYYDVQSGEWVGETDFEELGLPVPTPPAIKSKEEFQAQTNEYYQGVLDRPHNRLCASCHVGPEAQGDFTLSDKHDYDAAFEEVLSGRMPKGKEISADERLELLRFFKGE